MDWCPDEQTQRWRGLVIHRAVLMTQRGRIKNHVQSLLAMLPVQVPSKYPWTKTVLAWLRDLTLPAHERLVWESEFRPLKPVEEEVERADQKLTAIAQQEPYVRLRMTLPAVNDLVALGLFAALGDMLRIEEGDPAAAYRGLARSTRRSGRCCYRGSITKAGRSETRWLLKQFAQHAARHAGPLGSFFHRLARRKNRKVSIIALARKLGTILFLMLRNNEPYRDACPELM
jgi:transposase